jgi:hypothetical protein
MVRPPSEEPVVMVCDRLAPVQGKDGAIYVARVPDPAKLVAARSLRLHADAVEALVDLVIELAEDDEADGTGSAH